MCMPVVAGLVLATVFGAVSVTLFTGRPLLYWVLTYLPVVFYFLPDHQFVVGMHAI